MDMKEKVAVKNRSNAVVGYSIPDLNISARTFQPGETKQITLEELEALTYRPGGMNLIARCLLIMDEGVAHQILTNGIEPEYWLDEAGIKKLMVEGSLDEFLDCLDFAPVGVVELIKTMAVKLPLNDVQKRDALRKKFGYDVDGILANLRAAKEDEEVVAEAAPVRRVKKEEGTKRRTETPQYKVTSIKGE